MRSIYRTGERDETEKVSIGSFKTVTVAAPSPRGRKAAEKLNGLDALDMGS